jgi:transposase
MGRPYSEDLRSRIVAAVEGGVSRNAAARQFAVSVTCMVKLMQRFRRTGTVAPAPHDKKPYALERGMRLWFVSWLRCAQI